MTHTLNELDQALAELKRRQSEHKLEFYKPYKKQKAFHALGATKRERALIAANQSGKTFCASMELAMHLTGQYPAWWNGRRFDHPVRCWAAGNTSESVRDTIQKLLLGPLRDGTGSIPKEAIVDIRMGRGIADSVDTVTVRHLAGGISHLLFKSYEKGREKWQGDSVDFVWFDEEPPSEVYSEGLARVSATKGMVFCTFTPLLGMSTVVQRYMSERSPDRDFVQMGLKDVGHYTEVERAQIIEGYPVHEREARAKGIPMLGSGRVFQISEEIISEEAIPKMPIHWPRIAGIDFGIDHPTAVVWMAWDKDADVLHLYDCYRQSDASVLQHACAIRARGASIPIAWPHDGHVRDKGSGQAIADIFREQGLTMLSHHAKFQNGSSSVEAGIMEMQERFETGRLKVAEHLAEWFEEFRQYHRKDGLLVKERDDLLCATRYALMMKNYARPGLGRKRRRSAYIAEGTGQFRFSTATDYNIFGD